MSLSISMPIMIFTTRYYYPDLLPASAIFDFPEPFGPTIAVIPSANSKFVFEAKVL